MVKVFLDSGDLKVIAAHAKDTAGCTTNPSLLKAGGVKSYKEFALRALDLVGDKPISFEVFADDFQGMYDQAHAISKWGDNVYVKIPCSNTVGESTNVLVNKLSKEKVKINVTALFTLPQIRAAAHAIYQEAPAILSVFAGRIADTGRDPTPFITAALQAKHDKTEVLWASTREVLNVKQAEQCGADIITMTPDLIKKMDLFGKDLTQYSLETVTQFYNDGKGISL